MAAFLVKKFLFQVPKNALFVSNILKNAFNKNCLNYTGVCCTSKFSSSVPNPNRSLMEFFDVKDNWEESSISVGRPWKKDELRLKSNLDLHKLWYVLLKERNMLMTMEAEYKRQCELFPSPERLEKVEESMENILEVVRERNRAYNLLETGRTGEPGRRWVYNQLGIGGWRTCTEHYIPIYMNSKFKNKLAGQWQQKYLRLLREKRLCMRMLSVRKEIGRVKFLENVFPHLKGTIEPELSQFKTQLVDQMKGPEDVLK